MEQLCNWTQSSICVRNLPSLESVGVWQGSGTIAPLHHAAIRVTITDTGSAPQHQSGPAMAGTRTTASGRALPPLHRSKSLVLMEDAVGGKGEMFFKEKCSSKGEVLAHLSRTPFLEPGSPGFQHGRIYRSPPPAPAITWASQDNPRWDHAAPDWLTATEFHDTEQVVADKVERLAALLKLSRLTVVYTGAGVSTTAGVGQAARGGGDRSRWAVGGGGFQ